MGQILSIHTSNGERINPPAQVDVTYLFDNCALSLLKSPKRLAGSPTAQQFLSELRSRPEGTYSVVTGPATLEGYYAETGMSLHRIHGEAHAAAERLIGRALVGVSYPHFVHASASTLVRLFKGLFILGEASDILKQSATLTPKAVRSRIQGLAAWAGSNEQHGSRGPEVAAVYGALAGNTAAANAFNLGKVPKSAVALNGAWDFTHWALALAHRPSAPAHGDVVAFVTADSGVAGSFVAMSGGRGRLALPESLQAEVSSFVDGQTSGPLAAVASPAEQQKFLRAAASGLRELLQKEGHDPLVDGLQWRLDEVAESLQELQLEHGRVAG